MYVNVVNNIAVGTLCIHYLVFWGVPGSWFVIFLMNVANQLGGSRDFMPLELRIGVFDTTIQHVSFKIDVS